MSAKLLGVCCEQTEAGSVHAPATVVTIYMSAAIPAQAFMAQNYAEERQPIKSRCEKRLGDFSPLIASESHAFRKR